MSHKLDIANQKIVSLTQQHQTTMTENETLKHRATELITMNDKLKRDYGRREKYLNIYIYMIHTNYDFL